MFQEVRTGGEVVVLAVFEHKEGVIIYELAAHDAVGEFGEFTKRVGRIGKDEVEAAVGALDETKCIAADGMGSGIAKCAKTGGDETEMLTVALHTRHLLTATTEKFERDAASSGKEIEDTAVFEVNISTEDVENVFFGEVGRRTCLETMGHIEALAFVFTGYNAHRAWRARS